MNHVGAIVAAFLGAMPVGVYADEQTCTYQWTGKTENHPILIEVTGKGCVPFRGVKAEARMPWSEGEQGGMTGCHSGGADAPH